MQNSELSEKALKELRHRYNGRSSLQQSELETAQQSMELMRQNIQQFFDSEIQAIVQKYIEASEDLAFFLVKWTSFFLRIVATNERFKLFYRHISSQR